MKKILVVDDDPPMRWLLENILPSKCEIITKSNGMQAWSWISDGNIPDLIIEDINMPLLNGIEFLENLSISGLHKGIPVLVLSGFVDSNIRKQCLDLGALAYVVKPFQPERLLSEVNNVINPQML